MRSLRCLHTHRAEGLSPRFGLWRSRAQESDQSDMQAPLSLTGLLAPFESEHRLLRNFRLLSFRYLGHRPEQLIPRALRKLAIARGLMVYEGLR